MISIIDSQLFIPNKARSRLICLDILVVLGIWWPSLPGLKYPFFFLYLLFISDLFFTFKRYILSDLVSFLYEFSIILFLLCGILLGFVFTHKFDLITFKDFINTSILITIFFIMKVYIRSIDDFKYFMKYFYEIIIFLAVLLILFKFFVTVNIISNSNQIFSWLFSNSDNIDYNFALIPVITSLIILLEKNYSLKPYRKKIFLVNTLLLVFVIHILFSGSRRGLGALILLIIVILLVHLVKLVYKNDLINRVATSTKSFLFLILLVLPLAVFIFLHSPYQIKNKIIEGIGSDNILLTKNKITLDLMKYSLLFNANIDYNSLFNKIWKPEFNSIDPESSWGSRYHKTVFPLPKSPVDIPYNAKGLLIDSTCFIDPFPEVIGSQLPMLINQFEVNDNEKYELSIFCYVSEGFSGTSVRYQPGWKAIEQKAIKEFTSATYNLDKKGTWQKLAFEFISGDGNVQVYSVIDLQDSTVFNSMKGYVIFAYPQISNTKNILKNSEVRTGDSTSIFLNNLLKTSSIYPLSSYNNSTIDNIRNKVNRFFSDDTVHSNVKIGNEIVKSQTLGHRYDRWKFAILVFSKEYNIIQKILGNGFNFVFLFGDVFLKDENKSDWPHNPFLSILLYSGIIGLLIYCFFLYKVFYYYILYRKEYPLLFIFFLITFFFAFFSSGSPFDPPVFGFFSILPFFIHSVHKWEALSA